VERRRDDRLPCASAVARVSQVQFVEDILVRYRWPRGRHQLYLSGGGKHAAKAYCHLNHRGHRVERPLDNRNEYSRGIQSPNALQLIEVESFGGLEADAMSHDS
jgi:hypothetical protein